MAARGAAPAAAARQQGGRDQQRSSHQRVAAQWRVRRRKATQRFITGYAQDEAKRAGLGITFTAVLPQMTP